MMPSSGGGSAASIVRHGLEKIQLHDIKEKLSNYIQNVRSLRSQLSQADGLSAIRRLEEELEATRAAYEGQIQDLQQTLEGLHNLQTQNGLVTPHDGVSVTEYQHRLWELSRELARRDEDLGSLQLLVSRQEADIQGLRGAAVSPSVQRDVAQHELAELRRTLQNAQNKYEEEFSQRLKLQDRILELTRDTERQNLNHAKESQDLRARAAQAEALVLQLEARLRSVSRGGPVLMETVQKIQEASEAEAKRLRSETENAFNKSFLELQMRMSSDQELLRHTEEEKRQLNLRVEELAAELTLLGKKFLSEQSESRAVIENLEGERVRGLQHIRSLEARLEEMQDLLLAKMKESETFQNTNSSLRAELDGLKSMLEEEEQFMHSTHLHVPPSTHPSPGLGGSWPSPSASPGGKSSSETFSPLNSADSFESPSSSASSRGSRNVDRNSEGKRSQNKSAKRPGSAPSAASYPVPGGETRDSHPSAKETVSLTKITQKPPCTANDHAAATSSCLGDLEIRDVRPTSVMIINSSADKEEDVGGYILQQNVGGHPVSLYRFPPSVRIVPNAAVTVWGAAADVPHNPPAHFLWKEQDTFLTDPRCTTVLSTASGRAVAWYTPGRDKTRKSAERCEISEEVCKIPEQKLEPRLTERDLDLRNRPAEPAGPHRQDKVPVLIRREKMPPLVLPPTRSPWTQSVASPTHPHFSPREPLVAGKSSESRSAREEVAFRNSRGPTRSAGPNTRGVLYLGSSAPAGSVLHKFFANSLYDIRLASQVSLAPSIVSGV
ncbi:lamin tail domain-containing protein 1 [Spea bombifrons]|uniref:lamin tail domain-containing protein 1 n=1 Tax=Spea bombifrons TaxID=233779 RepID=UPI00234B60EF|nr:lamin tail domain-containing protein 1 [Spea bombifrons]